MKAPELIWDWGTAYDFFISLLVLHRPTKFGVRGAWAKGVRSRLPQEQRDFLEEIHPLIFVPIPWLYQLPAPKSGEAVLRHLGEVPANKRLALFINEQNTPARVLETLDEIAAQGTWDEADRERLWAVTRKEESYEHPAEYIDKVLTWWCRPEAFGENLFTSLKAFYEVFFAEEEARIWPALEKAVSRGKALAQDLLITDLLEELSQGVRFEMGVKKPNLVMIPSFWAEPLIITATLSEDTGLFVFGARPADASLVPGEVVPDQLFRGLKALADPTRLRILRYLTEDPLTPTELSKRLRLRPPTVIHHLNALRLAGLVYLTFEEKGDKRYAARLGRVQAIYIDLDQFLGT